MNCEFADVCDFLSPECADYCECEVEEYEKSKKSCD